jgi:hypothetical protein
MRRVEERSGESIRQPHNAASTIEMIGRRGESPYGSRGAGYQSAGLAAAQSPPFANGVNVSRRTHDDGRRGKRTETH